MSSGGFREEVLNVILANQLNVRGLVSVPENIKKTGKGRKIPDIAITQFLGIRIIIEGRYFENASDESSLIEDAKKRIEDGLCSVCFAVLYPPALRHSNYTNLENDLEKAKLRIKVITDTKEEDWVDSNVNGLASFLRKSYELLVREDVVAESVKYLNDAIEKASNLLILNQSTSIKYKDILGIHSEKGKLIQNEYNLRICRIASLTLVNALIFQEILSMNNANVNAIRKTLSVNDVLGEFSNIWNNIIVNIDYIPIFKVSRDLILELSNTKENEDVLKILSDAALFIVKKKSALKHDLMGRIYHRLLIDAKYFGAFYTKISSSIMLTGLTFDPDYWELDFSNKEKLSNIRIADLACGTGTLLKSSLESIIDDYIIKRVESNNILEINDIYKILIENTIHGYDVLPFAVHLAASALALHDPDIPFSKMNMFLLPLSVKGKTFPQLGSLNFLTENSILLETDLLGSFYAAPKQISGEGEISKQVKLPELDLCIMNPPFTRSVGGNLLFGNFPKKERDIMQQRLKKIVKDHNIKANITAGLGSVFVALGDQYVKKNGHISLVLPKSILTGVAWSQTRKLLYRRYRTRYVVVSHEAGNWNFSENTHLSECLIVSDRKNNNNLSKKCVIVNLWNQPKTSTEALALSSKIKTSQPAELKSVGICEIKIEDKKYGELISIPSDGDLDKYWLVCSAFAQTELIRAAYYLLNGNIIQSNQSKINKIPLIKLGTLFEIGPDRRDIKDGFLDTESHTSYPAIWGHDSSEITTIHIQPNRYLAPLSRALPGRNLRNAKLLWSRSGRLLIVEKTRVDTQQLFCIRSSETVLSNVWWPLKLKRGTSFDEDIEKIVSLWINSTLGTILLLSTNSETEGSWMQFKKPVLGKLPILDPTQLKPEQIKEFTQLFDNISGMTFLPWKDANQDQTRKKLDTEISRILKIPPIDYFREMLIREPIISSKIIQ